MRNVVLALTLFGGCGPHPNDPQTTDFPDTTSTGANTDGQVTDSVTATGPTTGVIDSTGTPDTDDPVITTLPTTGEPPPECDLPVMCGDQPCLDESGKAVCAPESCEAMPCSYPECPDDAVCGDLLGDVVCVDDGEVPCAPPCTPVSCEECPNSTCADSGSDVCLDWEGVEAVCREHLVSCAFLLDACTEDAHCAGGAPNCVNGKCMAECEQNTDCGLDLLCGNGVCLDELGNLACKVVPHDKPLPSPACEPLGSCMNDTDCPPGASTCWDLLEMGPVVAGEPGQCVAACTGANQCPGAVECSSKGFCANENGLPTCTNP